MIPMNAELISILPTAADGDGKQLLLTMRAQSKRWHDFNRTTIAGAA